MRLSPPGFGAPVPPGWRATPTAYRDWLADELTALDRPGHLVGHDWGGAHVVGVAMTRPDLLRSWCTDSIGWFEPDYAWHTLARTWQTPARRPGLVLLATQDRGTGTDDSRRTAAVRAGARLKVLAGLGHWWMLQDPQRAASLLRRFWTAAVHAPEPSPSR